MAEKLQGFLLKLCNTEGGGNWTIPCAEGSILQLKVADTKGLAILGLYTAGVLERDAEKRKELLECADPDVKLAAIRGAWTNKCLADDELIRRLARVLDDGATVRVARRSIELIKEIERIDENVIWIMPAEVGELSGAWDFGAKDNGRGMDWRDSRRIEELATKGPAAGTAGELAQKYASKFGVAK
jgi:hypothetical protein